MGHIESQCHVYNPDLKQQSKQKRVYIPKNSAHQPAIASNGKSPVADQPPYCSASVCSPASRCALTTKGV